MVGLRSLGEEFLNWWRGTNRDVSSLVDWAGCEAEIMQDEMLRAIRKRNRPWMPQDMSVLLQRPWIALGLSEHYICILYMVVQCHFITWWAKAGLLIMLQLPTEPSTANTIFSSDHAELLLNFNDKNLCWVVKCTFLKNFLPFVGRRSNMLLEENGHMHRFCWLSGTKCAQECEFATATDTYKHEKLWQGISLPTYAIKRECILK